MYINEKIKYKLRTDLCRASSNFESCFIEIENITMNVIVGVRKGLPPGDTLRGTHVAGPRM